MLLKRYNNIEFVLNLEVCEGVELVIEAMNQEQKQKLWDIYLTKYPYMSPDNFVLFEDFCQMSIGEPVKQSISNKTKDEILDEVEDILEIFKSGREL